MLGEGPLGGTEGGIWGLGWAQREQHGPGQTGGLCEVKSWWGDPAEGISPVVKVKESARREHGQDQEVGVIG